MSMLRDELLRARGHQACPLWAPEPGKGRHTAAPTASGRADRAGVPASPSSPTTPALLSTMGLILSSLSGSLGVSQLLPAQCASPCPVLITGRGPASPQAWEVQVQKPPGLLPVAQAHFLSCSAASSALRLSPSLAPGLPSISNPSQTLGLGCHAAEGGGQLRPPGRPVVRWRRSLGLELPVTPAASLGTQGTAQGSSRREAERDAGPSLSPESPGFL